MIVGGEGMSDGNPQTDFAPFAAASTEQYLYEYITMARAADGMGKHPWHAIKVSHQNSIFFTFNGAKST